VRDFASYMRAGAIVEEVFAVNPLHPGAAHYLIHSYDDPVHAPLGLRAARVYAQIAPAASHAQHMISHIFVALGRWDESVESNIQAFSVSEERAQRKGLSVDSLNFHALQWLAYSYLQLGRYNEAREQLSKIVEYAQESGSTRARWYQAVMDATWIVDTEGLGASTGPELSTLPLNGKAQSLFAAGHAAYVAGNPALANEAYRRLRDALEVAHPKPTGEQPDIYTAVSKGEILVARVLERSLGGLVTLREGREQEALEMFEEATALESERPLAFGPPSIVKPSHELYGEVLLALDRPDLARQQFEKALERAPGRSLSLAGLVRAAHAAGDEAVKAKACKELESIYAAADDSVGPPAICSGP